MLIDLDTAPHYETFERPRKPANLRWLALSVILAVATAAAVGGAESVPTSRIQHVTDIAADRVTKIVAIGHDLIVAEHNAVSTFDLATGERRWRRSMPIDTFQLRFEHGLVVAVGSPPDGGFESGEESIAMDLATGEQRWRMKGYVDFAPDGTIALYPTTFGWAAPDTDEQTFEFFELDGTPIWTLKTRKAIIALGLLAGVVSSISMETGELVEYDIRSGATRRKSVLPDAIGVAYAWYPDKDSLIVLSSDPDGSGIRYNARTLEPEGAYAPDEGPRIDCGRVWCEFSASTGGYVLTDKESGQDLHQDVRWEFLRITDAGVLGLRSFSDREAHALSFFDTRSGVVTDLVGWAAMTIDQPEWNISTEPVYLVKGRDVRHLAVLDDGGFHYVGVMADTAMQSCTSSGGYLACQIDQDLVRVWRLT